MRTLLNAVHQLARAMHVVSGVLLVVMMATVLLEVLTRTVFGLTGGAVDITFRGGVEIVSYGLLLMVLFALPYSVSRGQVIVDLFTEGLGERLKTALSGLYTLGFAGLGAGMAYGFYTSALRVAETGETTQDLLLPLYYIYWITAFAAAVLAVRAFVVSFEHLIESVRRL